MISGDHPFFFLEPLFGRSGAVFHFSRYVYTPDSLFDDRETFQMHGTAITVGWLEEQFASLKRHQELAIHSKVLLEGRTVHIPMLDFAVDRIGPEELDRIRAFLPERVFSTSTFYSSGRSYHAYATSLLGPKDWHVFLGRALLINPRDGEQIVDARWVGHRLIAGYCSLRLSNSSGQYRGMPKRVGIRALTESKFVRSPEPTDVGPRPSLYGLGAGWDDGCDE
jgi:hypothetical protein